MPNVLPRALLEQERKQRQLTRVVDTSVRRLWRRMRGRNWGTAWRDDVGPKVAAVVASGQGAAAASSEAYIAKVLAELDMPVDVPTDLNVDALVGVTGGGIGVLSAASKVVEVTAKAQYEPTAAQIADVEVEINALAAGEAFIREFAASVMADTMRAAEQVAMAQREWVDGYIRVIEPGACSRCALLGGKFYLFNDGFPRHPKCRCDHVPAPTNKADRDRLMATQSPENYFDSLSKTEQNRIFTNAGAEAIRSGADIRQVVNARRGMSTAQGPTGRRSLTAVDAYGQKVYVTTEGTTRRGFAYARLSTPGSRSQDTRRSGERNFRTSNVRLMPETILKVAGDDPAERRRLLILHGYVINP